MAQILPFLLVCASVLCAVTGHCQEPAFEPVPKHHMWQFGTESGFGYMDADGNPVIAPEFIKASPAVDGLGVVTTYVGNVRNHAVVRYDGKLIVPASDHECTLLGDDLIKVRIGRKRKILKVAGRELLSCNACRMIYDDSLKLISIIRGHDLNTINPIDLHSADGTRLLEGKGKPLQLIEHVDTKTGKRTKLPFLWTQTVLRPRTFQIIGIDGTILVDGLTQQPQAKNGRIILQRDRSVALVDTELKPIVDFSAGYWSMYRIDDDTLIGCVKDGRFGVLDHHGNELLPNEYQHRITERNGLFSMRHADQTTYLNADGDTLLPTSWTVHPGNGHAADEPDLFRVSNPQGQFGFVDREGEIVVPCEYVFLSPVSDERIVFFTETESGYLDTKGKRVLTTNSPSMGSFINGFALVGEKIPATLEDMPCAKINDPGRSDSYAIQYHYIDRKGKRVGDEQFDHCSPFVDGWANNMYNCMSSWVNADREVVRHDKFSQLSHFKDDRALAGKGVGNLALINANHEPLCDFEYTEFDLVALDRPNMLVLYDAEGPSYPKETMTYAPFFRKGLIRVRKGKKWGLLNHDGTAVVKPEFTSIEWHSKAQLYIVSKGDKLGLLGADGTIVAEPAFDSIGDVDRYGYFLATKGNISGQLHYTGAMIWPKP